jgi:hypothetical protein
LRLEEELKEDKVKKAMVELRLEEELKEAVFVDNNGTGAASNREDDVKGVEEGDVNVNPTSSEAKVAKLAKLSKLTKLVKLAKSTNLWCLSPYVPLEAKDGQKQRKVCPVNLRGEVCTADNCGSKHPEVCLVADHGKGKIPKATCTLWHIQIPRENPTENINNNNARPAKTDKDK